MKAQARILLALAGLAMRIPRWLFHAAGTPMADRLARSGMAAFGRRMGLAIDCAGQAETGGTLFVANHLSWVDIVALGSALDAAFVARSDLARWPLVGRLARRRGTLFVKRDRRFESLPQIEAIRAALQRGRDVILFPEGTTSDGSTILRFRSTLLAAADAARRVQPVAIVYLTKDGDPLDAARQRTIAWVGADRLAAGLVRVAADDWRAVLSFETPLDPARFPCRKALAAAARTAIAARYAALANRPK